VAWVLAEQKRGRQIFQNFDFIIGPYQSPWVISSSPHLFLAYDQSEVVKCELFAGRRYIQLLQCEGKCGIIKSERL
jgi:hypothetical protein